MVLPFNDLYSLEFAVSDIFLFGLEETFDYIYFIGNKYDLTLKFNLNDLDIQIEF